MQGPHGSGSHDEIRPGHERPAPGHRPLLSRRRFLATSGLAIAGATLYACTGGERRNPVVAPTPTASVTSTDTRWPIKRVVFVLSKLRFSGIT